MKADSAIHLRSKSRRCDVAAFSETGIRRQLTLDSLLAQGRAASALDVVPLSAVLVDLHAWLTAATVVRFPVGPISVTRKKDKLIAETRRKQNVF